MLKSLGHLMLINQKHVSRVKIPEVAHKTSRIRMYALTGERGEQCGKSPNSFRQELPATPVIDRWYLKV